VVHDAFKVIPVVARRRENRRTRAAGAPFVAGGGPDVSGLIRAAASTQPLFGASTNWLSQWMDITIEQIEDIDSLAMCGMFITLCGKYLTRE